ncbi:PDZ domain-containing protein [Chitinimonas naiadis]
MKPIQILAATTLLLYVTTAWAGERGYFGFSMSIDAEGMFWNPTLKAVKIEKVTPQSPAARAGITAGDYIMEVEGKPVAGAKADTLKPYLEREIGQSTRLGIKKPSGETVALTLVAEPKADKK